MFYRSRWWLLLQMAIDATLINAAIFGAWYIRYELEITPPLGEGFVYLPYTAYLAFAGSLTLLCILIFRFEGLYPLARGHTFLDEVYTLINGTTTATLLVMAFTFFLRPLAYSRAMYVYAALIIVVLLCIERAIMRQLWSNWRKRGFGVDRVLIIGAGEVGRALMRNMVAQPDLAYQIVGFVDDDPEKGNTDIGRFKALGETDNIARLLREMNIDEAIVTLPWTARTKIIRIMNLCQRAGVTAKIVPDMFQLSLSRVSIDDVGGIPLIGVRETRMSLLDSIIKRLIDLMGTMVLLLVFAPVMVMIAISTRLDSPGPIIFCQKRVGKNGREFVAFKFRTMHVGADEQKVHLNGLNEAKGPIFKMKNDPRRTRIGAWVRRTSMDELPQLFNVLRGDMSLVGPRPALPSEVQQYQEWHKRRFDVSPGITGLWQVSGRNDMIFDEMVMLDIYYIENWSAWMDVWILLRTIPTVLLARGAY
ncbi:MAG: undecaprenyl-phosphate glucose phosphotransferase [Chloroflexi bacterium]|nr:undecaprenyl-phosphate glucose phosphotransferase [Chloroflexota bacterium]